MTKESAAKAWQLFLPKRVDFRKVRNLGEPDTFLGCTQSAASVACSEQGDVAQELNIDTQLRNGDGNHWESEAAVSMDIVERVVVKRHLRKLQKHCRTKKKKDLALVDDAFSLAVKIIVGDDEPGSSTVENAEDIKHSLE